MAKKRKTNVDDTTRPNKIAKWTAQHVADYVLACDPSATDIASKIVREGISGRAALKIKDSDDLKEICASVAKRKALASTFKDLSHPLFPAFVAMDTNRDNAISSAELAHVLTRVKGTVVTEQDATGLIALGDADNSGDIDFEEFKDIAKTSAKEADWSKAAQAVGAPASLFGAGTAMLNEFERSMSGTHAALQAGAAFQHGFSALAGYQMPSLIMRIILLFIGWILAYILSLFTVGMLGLISPFLLYPQGQTLDMWCVSLQYKNLDGSDLGFLKMFGRTFLGNCVLGGMAGLMCLTQYMAMMRDCQYGAYYCNQAVTAYMLALLPWFGIMLIVDNLTALSNTHGQTLLEQIFGIVLVYRKPQTTTVQQIVVVQQRM